MSNLFLKSRISSLPKTPGVYEFRDKKGKILYIGKATSLKDRVRSYFNSRSHLEYFEDRPLIALMMPEVADIKVLETETVLEALILEANLIKKHQPKYNVEGKDDKSFVQVIITKEEFPRILVDRMQNAKIKMQSDNAKLKNKKIRNTCLAGRRAKHQIPYTKTYGPYTSKHQLNIALKLIRRIFPFHSSKQVTNQCCFDHQIGLCSGPHAGAISRRDYLKNIHGVEMILEGKKKGLINKLEREMKIYAKKHDFEKAAEARNRIFALKHIQDVALIANDFQGSTLGTPKVEPLRIEGYDISNIGGDWAVGSMVVFERKQPAKDEYRKFRIKTVFGIDDVAMMREVLSRRFRNKWPKPDLILLDGGKGHLNMAQQILDSVKLEIPIIAVAKGPTRKKMDIFQSKLLHQRLGDRMFSEKLEGIVSDDKLLSRIRDEAHRFAITYHKKLRIRNWKNS